ncbi:MAG: adenylyltransferase/cytidyltransferase family protein [Bacteroidales bacterium]|nr:adenylyltransferase/cytidyltransferase family protein [Bacteroidales bacterium]
MKKVFVSGCYDMLHSGHVAFFKEASEYGELHVGIGSDSTISGLKGRPTINSDQERLYMVKSIRYVSDAQINSGNGILDFEEDLKLLQPDRFIVNEDGHSPAKEALCRELGIEYIILRRVPEAGLPTRSTTAIRSGDNCLLPYRLDLAGTWIDQPFVSAIHPGWALTISLEPIIEYNERSGMSTSTRNAAKNLWPYQLPLAKPEKLAEMLFRFENKPGNELISGAQDAIGICVPGLARHHYAGEYWPDIIEKVYDENILTWLEAHLYLVTLWPRPDGTDLLINKDVTKEKIIRLTTAADDCWDAILNRDLPAFGKAVHESFEAQVSMFPNMVNEKIYNVINLYKEQALGWKLSGAGAGGYLALVSEKPIRNAMKLKIRRWTV